MISQRIVGGKYCLSSNFRFARIVAVNFPSFGQAVVQQVNTKLANMGYPPNICTWATGPSSRRGKKNMYK